MFLELGIHLKKKNKFRISFSGKVPLCLAVLEYSLATQRRGIPRVSVACIFHIRCSRIERTPVRAYWKPVPTSAVRRLSRSAIGRDRAGGRGGEEGERPKIRGSKEHILLLSVLLDISLIALHTRNSITDVFCVAHTRYRTRSAKMRTRRGSY